MNTISVENYAKQYVPLGAWIVIQKTKLPDKVGSIIVPGTKKDFDVKHAMTGTVIAKSPFKQFENEQDYYIMDRIKIGDIVGFSATVPVYSPAPPLATFEGGLNSEGLDIATLHVGDILGIFCESENQASDVKARF